MSLRLRPALCRLTRDLRGRLEGLSRVVQEVKDTMRGRAPETLSSLEQAGLLHYLRVFYAGVEDILLRIVAEVDCFSFSGKEWGRELLWRMTLDLPRVRPAILSPALFARLEAYRTFTAHARLPYGPLAPAPEQLFDLVLSLPDIYAGFAAEIETLLDYLWRTAECEDAEGQTVVGRE